MSKRLIRILHVDDREEEFILLREYLSMIQDIDFEFYWASNIETALQAIHSIKVDVCLVDYYLGKELGLELTQAVLAADIQIPFILLSGQKDPAIVRKALDMGVRMCIDKNDITEASLLKAIEYAMQN